MTIEVPFGAGTLSFEPPTSLEVEILHPPALPEEPAADAVRRALLAPVGSLPLSKKARGAADAVIAVPDATRTSSAGEVLPLLVDALEEAGVSPDRVTVIAALGMHRPLADAERAAIHGPVAARGVRFADHDPRAGLRDLGTGPQGVPILIHEAVASAGFVVALGVLEPHQYAGFSGGWKTVGIGCAGEATIAATHSRKFLESPRCRPGVVDGNPFLDVVKEAGRRAGLRFAVNLVPGIAGGVVAAAAGDPGVVHRVLAPRARAAFALPVPRPADAAVAGVGAPKDANLYQATRAATNLVLGPVEAVREGGTIVVPAPCPEGAGAGEGEKRFAEALRGGAAALLADRERIFRAGEQRAWAVAKVLEKRRIVIAGSGIARADLEAMGLGAAATVEEALAEAAAAGAKRLLVVPRALRALPVRS